MVKALWVILEILDKYPQKILQTGDLMLLVQDLETRNEEMKRCILITIERIMEKILPYPELNGRSEEIIRLLIWLMRSNNDKVTHFDA